MTKSSSPQTNELTPPQPRKTRFGWGYALLVLLFRLLLLGVSGSLAGLLGIAVAQLYPGDIDEPPLVEKLLRGSALFADNLDQMTQPEVVSPVSPAPDTATADPAPSLSPNPESSPEVVTPSPALSDADRQQIQAEIAQLQNELQQLNNRAAALEGRVGAEDAAAPLEQRLQALQRQLDPNAAPLINTLPPTESPAPSLVAPATTTLANGDQLMVTLPSDALFAEDPTILRPETTEILNSIVSDLRQYPGATIQVVGHTDSQGSSGSDRTRSFEQATAVKQYLEGQLGEEYRWVVVGYGNGRPLAENTSPINRQRNRRIEIVIDPN